MTHPGESSNTFRSISQSCMSTAWLIKRACSDRVLLLSLGCAGVVHGSQINEIRLWMVSSCRGEQGLGYSVHQLARLNRQLNDDADFAHLIQETPLAPSEDRLCSVFQIRCIHSCI